jgi:VIT1/CCC1 family predicted Fe2+/Mn2+ transporter
MLFLLMLFLLMPFPLLMHNPLSSAEEAIVHPEPHSSASEVVRDIVIGMADGLTVPFALAAGIAGAGVHTALIVAAGFAEIAAGSISMGLGGYLAARGEAEHYVREKAREEREVEEKPEVEAEEVNEVLRSYGLTREEASPVVASLRNRKGDWINFMMRFELGLEEPHPKRAVFSAITIAASYVVGGVIPLLPYVFIEGAFSALKISVIATLAALAVFGYFRGKFISDRPVKSMLQTVLVGGLAATAAFALARIVS